MQSKFSCVVFILLGAINYAAGEDNSTSDGSRYITYRHGNITHLIDLQAKLDPKVLQRGTPQHNQYLLFTKRNRGKPQNLYSYSADSISSSDFDAGKSTVVIVHGWLGSRSSELNTAITAAYLDKSDVNIIVVDWSWLAVSDYVTATFGLPAAGQALGRFLTYLNDQTGGKFSDMHLIGFSLGAHVVGNAARSMDTKVARITGLDPAGPLWSLNINRLQKTDAVYVEAIHTDRHLLGTSLNVGDTDFSPNGGEKQPGCTDDSCSHNRSWQLFAATVTNNNLIGRNCGNDLLLALNVCFGNTLPMGNGDLRKTGTGIYRLTTTSTYPYV